eukprot:Rhum_TRINITY_DN14788_c19_g1::Rhum_TRINITY_DN14788_c19_g1_i1::g.119154::m.119154
MPIFGKRRKLVHTGRSASEDPEAYHLDSSFDYPPTNPSDHHSNHTTPGQDWDLADVALPSPPPPPPPSSASAASAAAAAAGAGGHQRNTTVWNYLAATAAAVFCVLLLHTRGERGRLSASLASVFAAQVQAQAAAPSLRDTPVFLAAHATRSPAEPRGFVHPPRDAGDGVLPPTVGGGRLASPDLTVSSWNVEAPSNPFEFHGSGDDALASKFAERLLAGAKPVEQVFTPAMFATLRGMLEQVEALGPCFDRRWETYRTMTAAAFLRRVEERRVLRRIDEATNPYPESHGELRFRPAATGCGAVPGRGTGAEWGTPWFDRWREFMFLTQVTQVKRAGSVYGLVRGSSRCVGVDALSLAVYDAVMIDAFEQTGVDWRAVQERRCEQMQRQTSGRVIETLDTQHAGSDVILLQNVHSKLLDDLRESELGRTKYIIKIPPGFETDRRSNSVILLKVGRFMGVADVSQDVSATEGGRLCACTATRLDVSRSLVLLASHSGDPAVVSAVHDYAITHAPIRRVVMALHRQEAEVDDATAVGSGGGGGGSGSGGDSGDAEPLALPRYRGLAVVRVPAARHAKTHAQRAFSEAVAAEDAAATAAGGVVENYIVYSSIDYAAGAQATVLAGSGAGGPASPLLPSAAHPLLYSGSVLDLRAAVPEETQKAKEARFADRKRELLAPPVTAAPPATPPPTPLPTPTPTAAAAAAAGTATDGAKSGEPQMLAEVNGSLVLPPRGVGDYVGLPQGELYPPVSQKPGEITVTAVCDNGLGDRLGSLYSAIHLAWTLKANFHIVWNMNNECRARVSTLFTYDGSSSSVYNHSYYDNLQVEMAKPERDMQSKYDAVITLVHHFSTAHLVKHDVGSPHPPSGDGQWLCGESRKVNIGETGELVQWAESRKKRGLRTHILHHIDRLAQGSTLEGVGKAMKHFNFRINKVITDRVDRFCDVHHINPINTVGIHMRATDARIPLRLTDVLTDVRLRFVGRNFFVASDDPKAEATFLKEFVGRAVKNTMKTHYAAKVDESLDFRVGGKLGALRFNVERNEASVVDALTDMALLSRTERPIIDGVIRDSSFGKMSTTLCVLRLTCDEELGKIAENVKAPARPGS